MENLGKNQPQAYHYFSEAVKEEPQYYEAYYQRAIIKYNEALKAYTDPRKRGSIPRLNQLFEDNMKKVVNICPSYNDYNAYYYLGERRLLLGDREGAKEFFRKSIDTDIHYSLSDGYNCSKAMLQFMGEGKL